MAPSTTHPRTGAGSALAAAAAVDPALLWVGSVDNPSGFSDELRGFLRTLEAAGHQPALRDFQMIEKRAGLSGRDRALFERQKARAPKGPTVAVHHYPAARRQFAIDGAVNVHRAMFETDGVPEDRMALLLDRDQLWVPGSFNVETFVRAGVPEDKLRVVGETMDFDLWQPGADRYPLEVPAGHFVFLTNFAFSERKAWKQLIRAWSRAFGPDDGVCLVLKTQSETEGDDYVRDRIESFLAAEYGPAARAALAPIVVMTDVLPTAQLPSLYAAADAYVLASRGEGWGRPYMEALAMGLPTIASRWSGNLEFMHDGNSFLVDGRLVPCGDDALEVFGDPCRGHSWFDPDVDDLAQAMRTVAGDPGAARARAAGARDELVARFGPEPTARRVAELAREAWEAHGQRRTRPLHCAVRGPHGSSASLAVVNDGIVDALLARGHNVRRETQWSDKPLAGDAPGITHSWPPVFDPVTGGPTVAVLAWEFGMPPRDWVEQARARVDRVWVYSDFVRDGFVAGGMPPGSVEVVPLGVDLDAFTPDGPRRELPQTAGCTFLFVGGTTWRKGADILMTAWAQAFGPGDDVQLVVKDFGTATHYRNQTAGDQIRDLARRDDVAPVVYIEDELPFADLPALYRAADALVVPYRGEGFCLPALEAMACGVPVVHNGEGPTREFVGSTGGWPVPAQRVSLPDNMEMLELAAPGYVHEIDPAVLAERLRAVAADPAGRRERAAAALEQARRHGWAATAEAADRSLTTLREEALPLARDLRRTQIESREHTVVYAPDWTDAATWSATLATWAAAVGADAPVTLALHVPDADAEAIAGQIVGRLEAAGHPADALPDLALCPHSEAPLVALAASADAVLADAAADRAARPDLFRRARRVIDGTSDSVLAFAREHR